MIESSTSKFFLSIEHADWLTYNGEQVSMKDYLNSFSECLAVEGYPIHFSIKEEGIDWMTIESNQFPAALIIALFASPLEFESIYSPEPYFVVGNENCAFSNDKDRYFFIPELGTSFEDMSSVINALKSTRKDLQTTRIVGIKYLNPTDIPQRLPECIVGTPGLILRDGITIMIDTILNQHKGQPCKVCQPVHASFYDKIWKSLNKLYTLESSLETGSDIDCRDEDEADEFFQPGLDNED